MKRWISALAVLSAVTFWAPGCGDDDSSPDDGGRDEVREDATLPEADEAEVEEEVEEAVDGEDAADGPNCEEPVCTNNPPSGPVGEPCLDDTDCFSGFDCWEAVIDTWGPPGEETLPYISWAGGYCLLWQEGGESICDPNYLDCPTGSTIVYLGDHPTTGVKYYGCLDSCATNHPDRTPWTNNCDCRDGYECDLLFKVCTPGCTNDRQCCEIWKDGENGGSDDQLRQDVEVTHVDGCTNTCDPCTFRCINRGSPDGRIGGPCVHDSDCPPDGRCSSEWASEGFYQGGMCFKDRCDLRGRECPAGAGCANLGSSSNPFWICVQPCTTGTQPGDPDYPCRDLGEPGPSAGDYACYPGWVSSSAADRFWYTPVTGDGFCYPGNFPGGSGALGSPCTADSDCESPFGLGMCFFYNDTPPQYCSVACNSNSGAAGICGGDRGDGVASGVCWSGICSPSCDHPGANLGANGCPSPQMACYSTAMFVGTVAEGTTMPAGVCFTACVDDCWCSETFTTLTHCNTLTGQCEM